eukprot:TRINITY_DN148_c3_g1_i1.p1 TRINITY_DN148_c3_g1~~TRINITY_DN148_c3_g1_i1.p1  ORF type:complete len:482 (-),score=221.31 TRINITY_DN148_c3_g1_i1:80-1525(-)
MEEKNYGVFNPIRLWVYSLTICVASFLFGYDSACLNGPLAGNSTKAAISNDFDVSESWQSSLATSITILAAMIGALFSSIPSERFGRRLVLLVNNFFFVSGSLISGLAPNFTVLVIGRFIVGIGVGIASVISPQLLSEIAPSWLRGALSVLSQLGVTIGIFSAQFFYWLISDVESGWKIALSVAAAPAVLQVILFPFVPESPSWLIRNNKLKEAEDLLELIRPSDYTVDSEIRGITEQIQSNDSSASWGDLFAFKRIVFIGSCSMAIQQLTGINAVMYYSTTIFSFAGLADDETTLATIGVTSLNVLMTIVSVWLIEKAGRRPLLLVGLLTMTISLTIAGSVLLAKNLDVTVGGWIACVMVFIFVGGFAIGLGAVLWPLLGEILPSVVRAKGMSLCLFLNWTFNLILSLCTLPLIELFGGGDSAEEEKKGAGAIFIMFACLSIIGFIFMAIFIPETKGKDLDEIQRLLTNNHSQKLVNEKD